MTEAKMPDISQFSKQRLLLCLCLVLTVRVGYHMVRPYTTGGWTEHPTVPIGVLLGTDYMPVYVASKAVWAGLPIYRDNRDHGDEFLNPAMDPGMFYYLYPPLGAHLMAPLAMLKYRQAYIVWTCIQVMLVFGVIFGFRSIWNIGRWQSLFLVAVLLSSYPFLFALERGNWDLLVTAAYLAGLWLWLNKKSDYAVGFFVGAASAMKLFPLIFVGYFFLKRQWRAMAASLVWFMVLMLVGIGHLSDYLSVFQFLNAQVVRHLYVFNHATQVFLLRIIPVDPTGSEQAVSVAMTMGHVINLFLLATVSAYIWFAKAKDTRRIVLELCLIMLCMTLIPILSVDYKLVFFVFVLPAFVTMTPLKTGGRHRMLTWLGYVAIAHILACSWNVVPLKASFLELCFGSKFLAIIVLMFVILRGLIDEAGDEKGVSPTF